MNIFFLNIAIALSGVFADEKIYKTDAIILSAKKGRSTLCLAKFAAAVSVALLQGLSIIGSLFGVMFAFFGAEGSQGMIQNIIPSHGFNKESLIYNGLIEVLIGFSQEQRKQFS